ncbi:acyl-CoA carboxylase subunit beta [Chloroflexota bacterium]
MASMAKQLERLRELEEQAKTGGGKEAIEKQHELGRLAVRERIDLLFDKGSFVELNMLAQHQCYDFGMEKKKPWGDGIITGFGLVNGRPVYAYAHDATIFAGTGGHTHASKTVHLMRIAAKAKAPIVGLIDSGGGRIQEGSATLSQIFYDNIMISGVVPQISAIMGNCAGAGVYTPALTDFIFMVEGSQMFITGPMVVKEVTGEEISAQDLGGVKPQSQISGVCDFVIKNDEECIQMIKKLLGLLPSSYLETPPYLETEDDRNRCDATLADIIPEAPRTPFDMHKIISKIVDNGDFFEMKAKFARNIITGFARLGGYPVGIVANQPMVLAGALDCDASDKAARFYRTCDCFNVPIISFVDVPGYLPGAKEEHKGIIRHGAKMLYGYTEATVPKISVVLRKAYGGSYVAMGSKSQGTDITFAWPSAEIAVMGAEGAARVLYRKETRAAEDKEQFLKEKTEEFRDKFSTPFYAASRQLIDAIIRPQETRPILISALQQLQNKVEERRDRKHGNIPL